jgi:hypothetical protein
LVNQDFDTTSFKRPCSHQNLNRPRADTAPQAVSIKTSGTPERASQRIHGSRFAGRVRRARWMAPKHRRGIVSNIRLSHIAYKARRDPEHTRYLLRLRAQKAMLPCSQACVNIHPAMMLNRHDRTSTMQWLGRSNMQQAGEIRRSRSAACGMRIFTKWAVL